MHKYLKSIGFHGIDSEDLKLLKEIEYTIKKADSKTAEIILRKLIFDDIITKVKVKYSIEVQ